MTFDESFWSAFAFILLLIFVGRSFVTMVMASLDGRSNKIRSDIEEAARLREEAMLFLNTCKRQHHDAKEQAKEIIKRAEEESERLQKEASIQFHEFKAMEERALQDRILLAERQAIVDIEKRAVEIAMVAAEKVIRESMNSEKDKKYFEQLINRVQTLELHS